MCTVADALNQHTTTCGARLTASSKLRRLFQIYVKPLAQLIQSDFLVTGEHASIPQSRRGVKQAHRHLRRGVNFRNHESQIHRSLPPQISSSFNAPDQIALPCRQSKIPHPDCQQNCLPSTFAQPVRIVPNKCIDTACIILVIFFMFRPPAPPRPPRRILPKSSAYSASLRSACFSCNAPARPIVDHDASCVALAQEFGTVSKQRR